MSEQKCRLVYSGIGGQAVLEGVMMRSGGEYAVALRRQDGSITVARHQYKGLLEGSVLREIPFVRGTLMFVDSLRLGLRCTNESADAFMEEEEQEEKQKEEQETESIEKKDAGKKEKGNEDSDKESGWMTALIMIPAFALAIALFMILPYYLSSLVGRFSDSHLLRVIVEGFIRLAIFVGYVAGISLMEDIGRLYQYHGAEHKCINCLESGRPLTVDNVRDSSRLHKRCGSSFLMFVVLVSIVVCFFIRTQNPVLRVLLRLALLPVIAGISFELIRLAGRYENSILGILSAPGLWLQHITTREPDDKMIEVGIASVEKVFDWKKWLAENYGYDRESLPESGVSYVAVEGE